MAPAGNFATGVCDIPCGVVNDSNNFAVAFHPDCVVFSAFKEAIQFFRIEAQHGDKQPDAIQQRRQRDNPDDNQTRSRLLKRIGLAE